MSVRSRQKLVAAAFLVGVLGLWLIFSGRTESPIGGGSAAKPPSTTSSTLTIDITIADGNVDPSGERIQASVGQGVILNVKSDIDEELHAHVGIDGYALRFGAARRRQQSLGCVGQAVSWWSHIAFARRS